MDESVSEEAGSGSSSLWIFSDMLDTEPGTWGCRDGEMLGWEPGMGTGICMGPRPSVERGVFTGVNELRYGLTGEGQKESGYSGAEPVLLMLVAYLRLKGRWMG